ncbi:MAG: hypothetical protein JWN26_368 [Candidatus Saccharibacteria bacterium]|nr:hypothetical protein [Candidatus Saccharibacteria bacterium]
MTTGHNRTGKPRCGVPDFSMKAREEQVAYARIVVRFADSEVEPMSREALIVNCDRWKVLPPTYGSRSERIATIGKIIERIVDVENILVEGPSGRYYLWHDPRLQVEIDKYYGQSKVA